MPNLTTTSQFVIIILLDTRWKLVGLQFEANCLEETLSNYTYKTLVALKRL